MGDAEKAAANRTLCEWLGWRLGKPEKVYACNRHGGEQTVITVQAWHLPDGSTVDVDDTPDFFAPDGPWWMLVEAMRAKGYEVNIEAPPDGKCVCVDLKLVRVDPSKAKWFYGRSEIGIIPEAVATACLAAIQREGK